jgi:hypothetical protein
MTHHTFRGRRTADVPEADKADGYGFHQGAFSGARRAQDDC